MGFFSKVLAKVTGKGVSSVVDSIDGLFTSDEERLEQDRLLKQTEFKHEQKMRELEVKETEIYLKDVDSARDNQSRVQESEHSSWLSKNVQPLLAIVVTGICFFLFYQVMQPSYTFVEGNKDIIVYVLGILSSIVVQIMAYFFGSSKGSSDKNVHMINKSKAEEPVVVKQQKPKVKKEVDDYDVYDNHHR
tara:strand:- start:29098 stop:29667 length:570 start_codon:yes stop_codon:yes gene_type:complete